MIIINGTDRGNKYYERMRADVRAFYPELKDTEVVYLCNLVGNELRKLKCDVHEVYLLPAPFVREAGYYTYFMVKHRFFRPKNFLQWFGLIPTYRLYVRVTVD